MQCTNCGAALKPTAKICISCGTPVSSGSRSSIVEETSTATTVPTPNPDGRADVGSGSVPTSPVLKNSSSVESVSETVRYVPAVLEGDRVCPVSSAGHELAFDLHRANVLLVLPRGRVRPGWDVECLVLNDTASLGPAAFRWQNSAGSRP